MVRERQPATATIPAPATASQPLKCQDPAIQVQGSRNVYLFFVINCLRILKQLIKRNKHTLRLPPLSWPGGSWEFRGWLLAGSLAACLAVGGRLALAASWWGVWLLWLALCWPPGWLAGWLQHIRLSTAVEWEA